MPVAVVALVMTGMATFTAMLSGLAPEQWDHPSLCAGWSVRDVAAHCVSFEGLSPGELVTRFQSSVYAMALARVRDPLEAQELAQDVFVHAMKKLPQLRDPRCFAGWLRRITARMAINRLTRRGPLFGADPEMLDVVEAKTRLGPKPTSST